MDIGIYSIIICESLLLLLGFFLIYSWLTKTPFYPSSVKKLEQMVKDGDLKIPENSVFVDIGSGDGRIVLWAAKKGMKAEGIEFNPFLSLFSRMILFLNRASKKTIIHNKDFFKHNYSKYNMAYLYIFPEFMDKLKDKLFSEMPKGSLIITNTFKFNNLKPDEVKGRFNFYKVK